MPGVWTEVLLWISAVWTDGFIAAMRLEPVILCFCPTGMGWDGIMPDAA